MMEKVKLCTVIEKPISGEWGDDIGATKIIRTTNFTNNGTLNLKDVVKRNISDDKIVRKRLLPGDTIIEKSGGGPKQPVGRVVYFNENDIFLCNNFTSILRPLSNVDSKYLFWFLFNNHLNGRTLSYQNKTTGIINLKLTNYIEDIQIPLPDLATQKAIAAKLDKADEIRQLNKKLIEQYDALTQSLFLDMFGDPVKNEKGWEVKTIEHLVSKNKNSIKRGPFGGALKKEIFVSEGYLVYEQYHALNNDFTMERYFITEKKFKELEGFSVKAGDIIISCSGVYLGKLAVIPDDAKEGIINQALLKLTMNQEIMRNDFFVFHFSHENFKLKYFDSNRGAGIPNFPPMTDFKKFPFICPPLTLQNEFAERVKAIEVQKALAQQALQQSEDLFNSLLQESFQ